MPGQEKISRWAQGRFGDRAHQVRQGVVTALRETLNDAQNAQSVSKSATRHTFGGALLARKHETLATAFRDMDGVQLVRTAGSPFQLVVLNECLLFPFRYAQDAKVQIRDARITERHISGRIKAMFARFGPKPAYVQGSLLPEDEEEETDLASLGPALEELPPDTRLVLIAFACNEQAGLINIWWGEAELADDFGRLHWIGSPEELPLPADQQTGAHLRPVGSPSENNQSAARFDSGVMPPLETGVHESDNKRAASGQSPSPRDEASPDTSETTDEER